jgi:Gpi18-like mannosyltransferase
MHMRHSGTDGTLDTAAIRPSDYAAAALIVVFAVYVRYMFRNFITSDFINYTSLWYASVQEHGLAAAGTPVSNYTPPYLYLLYLTSIVFPHLPPVMAVKIPSIAFDLVCAGAVFLLVRMRYKTGLLPLWAALTVLAAPTVICNSGMWGQADSIYAGLLLGCILLLMQGRGALAMVMFALALSIKFQSMFLAPALCAFWLRRLIRFWHLLLVPVVYAVAMVPAWLEGRPALDLATVYMTQSVTYHDLSKNAPNPYLWLPDQYYDSIAAAGVMLMAVIGCYYVWCVVRSRVRLDPPLILKLCLLSLLMTPFFLPKMHERFFFVADVTAIAYAFYFPRQYAVAIMVSFASFFAYQPFLFQYTLVPIKFLPIVMGTALVLVAVSTKRSLDGTPDEAELRRRVPAAAG